MRKLRIEEAVNGYIVYVTEEQKTVARHIFMTEILEFIRGYFK